MSADSGWKAWQDDLFTRIGALDSNDLDAATRRRAALVVIDDLAAMVAAAAEKEVIALASAAARMAPLSESRVVGAGRVGRSWAALVNGVAAGWHELDEGYRPTPCHGGLYALPAAMAEVEANGDSVGTLLKSLVAGYEVSTAYARAMPQPRPLVLHPHATLAPVGAAAAVAAARGANGPGVAAAVHVAVTLAAAGPFSHATSGVLVRNGWAGHGAMSGFTAVELAAAGVVGHEDGPVDVFHHGLGNPISTEEIERRSTDWAIHDGYHKRYACCQYIHSAVEAALELSTGPLATLRPADVDRIVVETHPLARALDDAAPRTVLGGQFSLPHAIAAVLVFGNAESDTFGSQGLDDDSVAAVRSLVEIEPYLGELAPPHDRPARVAVTLRTGVLHVAECVSAVGGPDRPLSEADVLEKVEEMTAARAPRFAEVAAALVDGSVEDTADWREVLEEMWSR